MRTCSLLPAAVLLSACSFHHRPAVPEPARGPARDSLFQLDLTRADSVASKGAVEGLFALFSQDVLFLRAGAPTVYGRKAARALVDAAAEPASTGLSWQPLGGGVSRDLRSAYTFGIGARVGSRNPAVRLDRYIAYWTRLRGQPWRISAYAEVGDSPATVVGLSGGRTLPPAHSEPKAITDAIAKIQATDSVFSDLADRMGIAFAFAANVDPYGAVFGNPELVVGPKAVAKFYSSQGGSSSLSWHPLYADVAGSLDLGFTIGEYSVTSRGASGAAVQHFGKYLTVWKRQPDGTWKFVIDGGNATPAKGN